MSVATKTRTLPSAHLPLNTQMNIEADTLAAMELAEFSTSLHHVPFDTKSRVMLSIDGTTHW
jgi:hypothetical protein